MQNATKLYRVVKAIQGLILVALGVVICALYNQDGLKNAIGYCVASAVLIYGVLTIGFSYLFQRGIASTDMITGTLLSAVSVFLFIHPELIVQFIPVVAGSAFLIYAAILILETVIAFKGKSYIRGSIYILVTACLITLGTVSLVYLQDKEGGLDIVVMIIGIIIIIAGLTLSILQLVQPKKDIILQGSTLVTEVGPEKIEEKSTKITKKSSNSKSKSKKDDSETKEIKAIESKETKSKKNKKQDKDNEKNDDNKKATDEIDSDDVIIIDPEDK